MGGGENETGPQELITPNNGEQIESNFGRMGEISHTEAPSQRLSSDTKSIYKISLTLCEGKGGGCLAFELVCVLVCWGRGGRGLK